MKTNGEIEDRSTVRSLTPEECVNAALHQEPEKFLEAVQGRWVQKTTVKDLGPDVLNLVPDPENNDPWKDEDGPSFTKLDDELTAAEAAGDSLLTLRCFSPLGTPRSLQGSSVRSVTVSPWAQP